MVSQADWTGFGKAHTCLWTGPRNRLETSEKRLVLSHRAEKRWRNILHEFKDCLKLGVSLKDSGNKLWKRDKTPAKMVIFVVVVVVDFCFLL